MRSTPSNAKLFPYQVERAGLRTDPPIFLHASPVHRNSHPRHPFPHPTIDKVICTVQYATSRRMEDFTWPGSIDIILPINAVGMRFSSVATWPGSSKIQPITTVGLGFFSVAMWTASISTILPITAVRLRFFSLPVTWPGSNSKMILMATAWLQRFLNCHLACEH